jgi:hypothetical protein
MEGLEETVTTGEQFENTPMCCSLFKLGITGDT